MTDTKTRPEVTEVRERTPRIDACARGAYPKRAEDHTIWMVDIPRKIQEWKTRGFRMAKPEEIEEPVVNWDDENPIQWTVDGEGYIRNGDLLLMIGSREYMEKRSDKQRRDLYSLQSTHEDHEGYLESKAEHGKTVKGKFYPMP